MPQERKEVDHREGNVGNQRFHISMGAVRAVGVTAAGFFFVLCFVFRHQSFRAASASETGGRGGEGTRMPTI